jgi:hypothetical protein
MPLLQWKSTFCSCWCQHEAVSFQVCWKVCAQLVKVLLIDDSPCYVFVALCIVVIVVSLIFKMAYFLSWPVQEVFKNLVSGTDSKIFAKTFNIFIWGHYLYQWYHYNHNAKLYENIIKGIIDCFVYFVDLLFVCTILF